VSISIEEAVQLIKAEIIAPDWRLSAKRIESLTAAFVSLQERFGSRKRLKDIITMAVNVLQYIKIKGDNSPPDSVDFLKEAMADIINLYEEGIDDSGGDERVFKKVLGHFQRLKERIKLHKARRQAGFQPEDAGPGSEEEVAAVRTMALLREDSLGKAGEGALPAGDGKGLPPDLGQAFEVERLVAELQESLQRAEEVGAALRQILGMALVPSGTEAYSAPGGQQPVAVLLPDSAEGVVLSRMTEESLPRLHQPPVECCQPSPVLEIVLGGHPVALPADGVALVRPLTAAARANYLREGQVPLRDFHRLFQGLARQFKGALGGVSDRKLKKMALPVISLQSFGFPELPDEQANKLLVLSHGQWHGVLFCTDVNNEPCTMVNFRKAANGDIAGVGYLEDGKELPLANLADFLRREGFLALV
jgi:hypothetical protein